MTHYVMDCYATAAADDCESFPINAGADAHAIWEAKSAAMWRKPTYFQLREAMRHGDRAVYDSRKDGGSPPDGRGAPSVRTEPGSLPAG